VLSSLDEKRPARGAMFSQGHHPPMLCIGCVFAHAVFPELVQGNICKQFQMVSWNFLELSVDVP
jgi:hypothetical protein